jgi:hypothetical protein
MKAEQCRRHETETLLSLKGLEFLVLTCHPERSEGSAVCRRGKLTGSGGTAGPSTPAAAVGRDDKVLGNEVAGNSRLETDN